MKLSTALACWLFGHWPAFVVRRTSRWWAQDERRIAHGFQGDRRCVRCWRRLEDR